MKSRCDCWTPRGYSASKGFDATDEGMTRRESDGAETGAVVRGGGRLDPGGGDRDRAGAVVFHGGSRAGDPVAFERACAGDARNPGGHAAAAGLVGGLVGVDGPSAAAADAAGGAVAGFRGRGRGGGGGDLVCATLNVLPLLFPNGPTPRVYRVVDLRIISFASGLTIDSGLPVVGAGIALMLAGHWRRPRGWPDRFGRIVGGGWLVVLVFQFVGVALRGI